MAAAFDQNYSSRVSDAVFEAVMAASRPPGGGAPHVDLRQAVCASASALSSFIIAVAATMHATDNEAAAVEIERLAERVAEYLKVMGGRAREGTLLPTEREKPKLRLVD